MPASASDRSADASPAYAADIARARRRARPTDRGGFRRRAARGFLRSAALAYRPAAASPRRREDDLAAPLRRRAGRDRRASAASTTASRRCTRSASTRSARRRARRIVQIGAGAGYYTAILARLVGQRGSVIAYEIEPDIAERARANLARYPQVEVRAHSGVGKALPRADCIYVNAAASHPVRVWLDALNVGGRLLFPLQAERSSGAMLLVTRPERGDAWPARIFSRRRVHRLRGRPGRARSPASSTRRSAAAARAKCARCGSAAGRAPPTGSAATAGRCRPNRRGREGRDPTDLVLRRREAASKDAPVCAGGSAAKIHKRAFEIASTILVVVFREDQFHGPSRERAAGVRLAGIVLRGSCFARAPQDEVRGFRPQLGMRAGGSNFR